MILIAPLISLELLLQFLGHSLAAACSTTGCRRRSTRRSWLFAVIVFATVLCVAIPIKIWNSARIEHRLQEQEKLLMAARMQALASQINPHFLFNTLTSISSLIRSQPETARTLIVRLSGLLRRLLRAQDHFVTLREELEAIDEYLDIEAIRFGSKLRSRRRSIRQRSTWWCRACCCSRWWRTRSSMACRRRSARDGSCCAAVVRTDTRSSTSSTTASASPSSTPSTSNLTKGSGIGLQNVNERLRVIYGANYQLQLDSVPGEGTCVRIVIPELIEPARISA